MLVFTANEGEPSRLPSPALPGSGLVGRQRHELPQSDKTSPFVSLSQRRSY